MNMINALQDLVSIKSVAEVGHHRFYGGGPASAVKYVINLCRNMGFRTFEADGYAFVEIGDGDKLIGILSHLDVVDAGNEWTFPPFEGTITEDRIYGRGTIDDKGPTIATIFAMKDILDSGILNNRHKRIRLILGQTEENGEWTDIEEYCRNEQIPDYGFTPDGDFPAIFCESGALVFRISMPVEKSGIDDACGGVAANMVPSEAFLKIGNTTYHGTGKTAHGCAPWMGENAISDVFKAAHCNSDAAFVQMYNELIGNTIYGEKLGVTYADSISGKLTINAGKLFVEDNQVILMLDLRCPVTGDLDSISEKIVTAFQEYGAEAQEVYRMNPVHMDDNGMVMKSLLSAYREITGDYSKPIAIPGGTYARAMKNIIAFGPNFPGHENREHRGDEYILLEDLENLRLIYRKALENLLKI